MLLSSLVSAVLGVATAFAAGTEGFGPYRFGMSVEASLRVKNCQAFSMDVASRADVVPSDELEAICPWTGVLPAPVDVRLRYRGGRLKEAYVVVAMSPASRRSLTGTFTGLSVVDGLPKDVWRSRPAKRTMFRLPAFPKREATAAKLEQPSTVAFEKVRQAIVARAGTPSEPVDLAALGALNRGAGPRLVERWRDGEKLVAFVTYVHEGELKQTEISLLGQE